MHRRWGAGLHGTNGRDRSCCEWAKLPLLQRYRRWFRDWYGGGADLALPLGRDCPIEGAG